ncbi:B12-binding domain-containing radical SAM protein [bacterium]|nr:B12-binding domain-containing radical SAM protein [bacterium]
MNRPTRVLFVEPRGVKANVFARYLTLPLMGPLYLGTLLHQQGYDVKVFNENISGRDITLSELDADLLCLSGLTATIERGYEIARLFRARNPHARIIFGGIHASMCPEEASQVADHVVVGEGEDLILDLVRYGSDQKILHTDRIDDLDRVPLPDLSLLYRSERMRITPIITSRGCPFGCTFCSVTKMFGRQYRMVSVDRVIEELERAPTRQIFFYDDNFVANKKRTHQLLERILRLPRTYKWTAQVRTDLARDPGLVEKMAASGCKWVYAGLESIDDQTLKSLNKSQTRADIEQAIAIFHRYGISVHGMFMFGSDRDDPTVFQQTVEFSRKVRLDSVQYLVLTPFPGTEIFEKMVEQKRLLHSIWSYYDAMHAVFEPKLMSAEELQRGMYHSFNDFYALTRLLNDSFSASIDYILYLLTRLLRFWKHRSVKYRRLHVPLFLVARRIVSQWHSINRDYFRYLHGLDNNQSSGQS